MAFFNRVGDIISANLNDILDRMENPSKMMKQLVREMDAAAACAKDDLVKAIAHRRRVEKEMANRRRKVEDWHARAVEAVKRDRDDLARKALELKAESEDVLAALEIELQSARAAAEAMKTQLKGLQAKASEARRKEASLAARSRAAGARRKAAIGSARASGDGAFAEFDRMQEKVEAAEAEADAVDEVSTAEKSVAAEFEGWEAGGRIDGELAAIKARAGRKAGK